MGCCSDDEETNEQEVVESNVRGCTDVFWLCVYIVFWLLMVVIAAFSFVYGNPIRIINGYDSFGNVCGVSKNQKIGNLQFSGISTIDKPYLLFYDIKELKQTLKTCVKKCPDKKLENLNEIEQYYRQTGVNLCTYNFDFRIINNRSIDPKVLSTTFGPCPKLPIHKSSPVLNRCVPVSFAEVSETILKSFYDLLNNWDILEQILGDLYKTWKLVLALTFLSFLISLLTICILHWLAHLVSYIIMVVFTIASIAGTVFLWYTYIDIKNNLNQIPHDIQLFESLRNKTAFLWYSIIATVITVVILILVVVMAKQVGFLANLFRETTKCLMHLPALFLQPIVTFIWLTLFFIFWIFVVLCLATAYYPGSNKITSTDPQLTTHLMNVGKLEVPASPETTSSLPVVDFTDPIWVKYMWWVYFVGLIWTSEFIMGCQQMVIAGSVAHWFYRHKYSGTSHVSYAICKLVKYHLGSIALGSLLITIFKIPRLILMYLHEKIRHGKDKGSECAACALKCCICCFYCLEKFIRYLNHNAYTVIAIDGVNFCTAAGTACEVLSSHALQVATINGLGDFILFLGKCLVTAVTGSVGLYLFRKDPDLKFFAAPTLIVCIFAFFVAHCILSLYEMVLDTVYLCKCQNGEAPDGIQMENIRATKNGNTRPPTAELEPMQ